MEWQSFDKQSQDVNTVGQVFVASTGKKTLFYPLNIKLKKLA